MTTKEKKALTEEEKEFKSKRKEIQEKLIKFATRIPVFMYLTDFREYCLKDVITQLEPDLFRKVTGLTMKDFSLLVSLNVFNSELMNDAVYKFKRYEDSSLEYTGINTYTGTKIGGWDTVIDTAQAEKPTPYIGSQTVTSEMAPEDGLPASIAGDEPALEPWMNLHPGDKVIHKSMGEGIVMALADPYIIVKFPDRESRFKYPDAFEKGYFISAVSHCGR